MQRRTAVCCLTSDFPHVVLTCAWRGFLYGIVWAALGVMMVSRDAPCMRGAPGYRSLRNGTLLAWVLFSPAMRCLNGRQVVNMLQTLDLYVALLLACVMHCIEPEPVWVRILV